MSPNEYKRENTMKPNLEHNVILAKNTKEKVVELVYEDRKTGLIGHLC